jgi:hypothetical protein
MVKIPCSAEEYREFAREQAFLVVPTRASRSSCRLFCKTSYLGEQGEISAEQGRISDQLGSDVGQQGVEPLRPIQCD